MDDKVTVLITGAAGNLGRLLARRLVSTGRHLRLMFHRRPIPEEVRLAPNGTPVQANLSDPDALGAAVRGADVVVHFAGVLFAPEPEKVLAHTNLRWFANLLAASLEASVRRVILMSFPHVEGPTSADAPATGRLDCRPVSVHAQTRSEEERLLFSRTHGTATTTLRAALTSPFVDSGSLSGSLSPRRLRRHGLHPGRP